MPAVLLQRGHTAAIKGSQTAGSRLHRCTAASLRKGCGQYVQAIDSINQVSVVQCTIFCLTARLGSV
jgi:hypothetical protein